ncbi:ThiF family adenylyltransferase [Streptomyces sp. R1]|uniref:HesA/MoeB/ThiF family protein n=1 Tax=unclassified Streptomyces TaxID=2593676 RepID=UPI00137EC881|nr:ThiF family adenylyltransferase [Streptomyces sp. R1]MCC8335443.1 ThiF family adenylyltransferase [Streptomyces sp. R1]MYS56936.1 ThiF family adenylyltransferase [Streptomyces sp. SID6013]
MTVHAMRRPRIKPEHRAYRTVDGHVRIGSVVHGIGAEVRDADGWVWSLVQAMDGTRSATDVVAEVSRRHPELRLPEPDIAQAMTDLTDAGYVEDAGAEPPAELSERERERYSRGMTLLRWMDLRPRSSAWEPQLLLRRARVLLIGVGGTGSAAARDLVASGVGRLHCVEPDVVELSNLNRQTLFREDDLGKPKLDAALTALRALNPDTEVTGERREVRGPADLEDLLTGANSGSPDGPARAPGYDALLLAADRPAAIRRWANQVCLSTGTPWAEAGYRGPLVSVGVFTPGRGACWQCLRDAEVERRDLRLGPGQDEDAASPRMPWNPANAVTAGLSGGLLAHAALMLLCGVPPVEPGCRFGLNLMMPGDPVMQRARRRPDCPACRRAEPVPVPDPVPAARSGSGDRDPS